MNFQACQRSADIVDHTALVREVDIYARGGSVVRLVREFRQVAGRGKEQCGREVSQYLGDPVFVHAGLAPLDNVTTVVIEFRGKQCDDV